MSRPHTIIVFDGECVLCSANARFVLRHDRHSRFRLAAAQGPAGRAIYTAHGLDPDAMETMVVVEDGRALTESDAAIALARGLGWPWRAAALFGVVPRRWRDAAYRLVARNRYRWFGRRDTCMVPPPGTADRFL